ncbi:MAG: ATP-binding protein [Desulfotomaculaceae bacterium]|nr:ATP-binding protein [Desulfotomaculaceae bacterium]
MQEVKAKKVFPAKVALIPEISEYVSDCAEKAELHPKQVIHLQVAIDEVVANICHYAYQNPPGEVLVQIESGKGRFAVDFIDEGVPFDPLTVDEPDIDADIPDREVGGLGIFLVRRVIDEVHYKRDGIKNILTLVLYAPKTAILPNR